MNGKHILVTITALVLIAGAILWLSLPTYGKISPHGYELTTALYSACNQRNPERVAAVAELTQRAAEENELSPNETEWLAEIIDNARAERWQRAGEQTRELMEAQVER